MKKWMIGLLGILLLGVIVFGGMVISIVAVQPEVEAPPAPTEYADKQGDEELAYLLVNLVLRTRGVLAGHYGRAQSPVPGIDVLYKRWLARNHVLPAAVADPIFFEVVPGATGGRAWVKMVVDSPRNPHNRGDAIALQLLQELREGNAAAERTAGGAYYYAEPILSTAACLYCHGEPKGATDPLFPQFRKDGWTDGEIVGAVVARVAPEGPERAGPTEVAVGR